MMADHEDSSFTFVDKRNTVHDDQTDQNETPPSNIDTPQEEVRVATGEETPDNPEGDMSLSITDQLVACIELLHQGAWICMGLRADPATNIVHRDMEGARMAIDTIEYIAGKLEAKLDRTMQRELKNLLTDLRLNYVEQMNR